MKEIVGKDVFVVVGIKSGVLECIEVHPGDAEAIDAIAHAMIDINGCDRARVFERKVGSADREGATDSPH